MNNLIDAVRALTDAVGTLQRRGDESLISLRALSEEVKLLRDDVKNGNSIQSSPRSFKPIGERVRRITANVNQDDNRESPCSEPWFIEWLEKISKRADPTRVRTQL